MQALPEHHVETEDVEHGEHAVEDVALLDTFTRGPGLLDVAEQVAVRQHRRTGRTGGAAGEDEHRHVVGLHLDRVHRLGGEQLVEQHIGSVDGVRLGGDDAHQRRHRRARHVRPGRGSGGFHDHDLGIHRGQFAFDLGAGTRRVQRHGDRTEAERGQVHVDEVATVAAEQRHTIAGLDAHAGEAAT